MGDKQQQMKDALEALGREKGIVGSTLITRDGLCVLNCDPKILAPETFSAMSATLVSAAETAFMELGGAGKIRIMAETDSNKIVALGATDELLLVIVCNGALTLNDAVSKGEAAAAKIRAIFGGR